MAYPVQWAALLVLLLSSEFIQIHPKNVRCSHRRPYISFLLFYKALEAGEIEEGTAELEISQRHKAKLMDPGKLAFVQKYLEDVADTRSMTNVSDSGLATHTAASELGTEEIHGKLVMLCYCSLTKVKLIF